MASISYHDIQYQRDSNYLNKLRPAFDELLRTDLAMGDKIQAFEEAFYFQLSNSVKVDNLSYVSELVKKIFSRLNINLKIDIFIYLSNIPNALCMPRYHMKNYRRSENVMILVSQHFFNDLNPEEQISILGHEIGHYLFGHINIPKDILLKTPLKIVGALQLKSDILKWGICAEISSDIIGLVANGLNSDAFISAMLKFTTGLNNSTYNKLGVMNLKKTVLNQFQEITHSVQEQRLVSHPMTPLRLKLAENLARKEILRKYGTDCSQAELDKLKHSLNTHIDHYVSRTYPDILPDFRPAGNEMLIKMAIAVSISDGTISQKEFEMISSFTNTNEELSRSLYMMIDKNIKSHGNNALITQLVKDSIAEGFRLEVKKPDIIQIVRNLLIIAVGDGNLCKNEFDTIVAFANPFGISREEIIFLKNQMRL
jgi:predicted metallopeptidase/uncharacterized tellurite resistance protein B-like protein